jgi:hypothetical protein
MIKWIWYGNVAVILAAVLVLVIGLSRLTARESSSSSSSGDTSEAKAADSTVLTAMGDQKNKNDSALVEMARKYSERWKEPVGSVQIALQPNEIIGDESRWRVDGGDWQTNNTIINNLPLGKHTISFKAVNDWIKPKDTNITVVRRKISTARGIYEIVKRGSLKVTLGPAEAMELKPQWKVEDGAWQESGATVSRIPAGKHTVMFMNIDEWNKPADISVEITHEQTAEASATYVIKPVGSIKVVIDPAPVLAAKAQWRLDDGKWQDSGATLDKIPAGSHQIRFNEVEEWWKPEPISVKIVQDQTTETTGIYALKTYGSVRAIMGPDEALKKGVQWRVDGNPWQESGAIDDKVLTGVSHMVTFNKVDGWDKIDPVTVKVEEGQLIELTATYVETKPPPPGGVLVRSTLAFKDKEHLSKAWIKLAMDPKSTLFSVGESIGKYKIVSITEGEVHLTRGQFKYTLNVTLPQVGVDPVPVQAPDNREAQTGQDPNRELIGPGEEGRGARGNRIPPERADDPPTGSRGTTVRGIRSNPPLNKDVKKIK